MSDSIQTFILPAEGFCSREAASSFSQLEDQSKRLLESVRGITSEELEWQPAPGMNTIGMLMAHFAIAEVLWTEKVLLGKKEVDTKAVIGLALHDDGIPLAPDGKPPALLKGKSLAEYEATLAKARAYYREAVSKLSDEDAGRQVTFTRFTGASCTVNIRWVMYHVLEHFAGHFGQVLLLRHLYRATVSSK